MLTCLLKFGVAFKSGMFQIIRIMSIFCNIFKTLSPLLLTMAALQTVDHINMDYCGYEPHLFVDQNAATMYQCGMYVMIYINLRLIYIKFLTIQMQKSL